MDRWRLRSGGTVKYAWLLFLVPHCTANLALDLSNEQVACTLDAQCTSAGKCVKGRCYPRGENVDVTAPAVAGTSPISSTLLSVTFSKPVSLNTASFTITPALDIAGVSLAADKQSADLATAPQTEAESYTLTVTGLVDLDGNAAPSVVLSFSGFGIGRDQTPPVILAPKPDAKTFDPTSIDVVWTSRHLATSYLVELASDPGFTDAQATTVPAPADGTSPSVNLASLGTFLPIDYYLRISSDNSLPCAVQRIAITDPARIYVAPTSHSTPVGNRSRPFTTVSAGMIEALATATVPLVKGGTAPVGIRTVALAGGTYASEVIQPLSGTHLSGGYDPTTWQQTPALTPTLLSAPEGSANVVSVIGASAVTIDSVKIAFADASAVLNATALTVDSSPAFALIDSQVSSNAGANTTAVFVVDTQPPGDLVLTNVQPSPADAGATFLRTTIFGGLQGASNSRGLVVQQSNAVVVDSCTVYGSAPGAVTTAGATGIRVNFAGLYVSGSTVYGGDSSYTGSQVAVESSNDYYTAGLVLDYSHARVDAGTTLFNANLGVSVSGNSYSGNCVDIKVGGVASPSSSQFDCTYVGGNSCGSGPQ